MQQAPRLVIAQIFTWGGYPMRGKLLTPGWRQG